MPSADRPSTMRSMEPKSVHLEVDVVVDGPLISGDLSDGPFSARHFSGRLGLMAAIERALDTLSPEPETDDAAEARDAPASSGRPG